MKDIFNQKEDSVELLDSSIYGVRFNETQYLLHNKDVAKAVSLRQINSGAAHWWKDGRSEGRAPFFHLPEQQNLIYSKGPWLTIVAVVTEAAADDLSFRIDEMLRSLPPGVELLLVEYNLEPETALLLWEMSCNKKFSLLSTVNICDRVYTEIVLEYCTAKVCLAVPLGLKFNADAFALLRKYSENKGLHNSISINFKINDYTFWTACISKAERAIRTGSWWSCIRRAADLGECLCVGSMQRLPTSNEHIYLLQKSPSNYPKKIEDREFLKRKIEYAEVVDCKLNVEALKKHRGVGCSIIKLKIKTPDGAEVLCIMKLHLSEKLDGLIIADPRAFTADGGFEANSINSPLLARRQEYGECTFRRSAFLEAAGSEVSFYYIKEVDIVRSLNSKYDLNGEGFRAKFNFLRKPSIAFLIENPSFPGGGTTISLRYCQWFIELGVDVTVYSDTPLQSKMRANVRSVVRRDYNELVGLIEEPVVIVFTVFQIEHLLEYRKGDKLLIHLGQGYESYQYGNSATSVYEDKPIIRLLDSIPLQKITVSDHLRELYRLKHEFDSHLIINGIDLSVFSQSEKAKTREPGVIKILSIGHPYHPVKGISELNLAMIEIADANPDLTVKWLLLNGADGSTSVAHLGGPSNLEIKFLGNRTSFEVAEEMRKSDIFINPSYYEGFGLPTIEAMACGTPVVASRNCGLDYIVEDQENALLCLPGSVKDLVNAISKIIHDEKLAHKLRDNGLSLSSKFDLLTQFDQFQSVFENLFQYNFPKEKVARIRSQLKLRKDLKNLIRSKVDVEYTNPVVSVVMPTFNRADFLAQAIESVMAQTFKRWELIIVDDGSSDSSIEIAKSYALQDGRIRVIEHKRNQGIARALNTGVAAMRGAYFSWLSSDDLFHRDILKEQLEAFSKLPSNYGLVYSSFDLLHEKSGVIQRIPMLSQVNNGMELGESFKFDYIHGCSAMIKREVLDEVGGFQPLLAHGQDSEMWMRIGAAGYHFYHLPKKLLLNRVHAEQSSATNMIRCRFDTIVAHWYYLTNFSLFEIYRNTCILRSDERKLFIEHIVDRFSHPEASVNSPILGVLFIDWLAKGLKLYEPKIQIEILTSVATGLEKFKSQNPRVIQHIEEIRKICSSKVEQELRTLNYSASNRTLNNVDWSTAPILEVLLQWSCKQLLDPSYPSIGKDLFNAHDTHLWCREPYAVAHALIAYLGNWQAGNFKYLKKYDSLDARPVDNRSAENLFIRAAVPSVAERLLAREETLSNEIVDRRDSLHDLLLEIDDKEKARLRLIFAEVTPSLRVKSLFKISMIKPDSQKNANQIALQNGVFS